MNGRTLAIVTPSYAGDRERCLLLCESLDRMARDPISHYVLVADHDLSLFRDLNAPHRTVIADSEILPAWLKARRRPFGRDRWIWTSLNPPIWPMSGWHVQQLRKMLLARHISEDVMVMADSDSLFVRPFGQDSFVRGDAVRLYRKDAGITVGPDHEQHRIWVDHSAEILGLPQPSLPAPDYINNLVSWRRDHVLGMLDLIEQRSGKDLIATLGRSRTFSEYQIYGAYVDGLSETAGHFVDSEPLSLTYWKGEALTDNAFAHFVDKLALQQIAVCVQSFTGTSTEVLRNYLTGRLMAL
jgi:hypothetical protein